MVLSGAGISTASGIPDYRSPNRPAYKPLQNADFFRKESVRRRYWARSSLGYRRLSAAEPNGAHFLVAALEAAGCVRSVITQNVDRLHQRAGSRNVLELHGTVHEVACMDCGLVLSRQQLQRRMESENAGWQRAFAPSQEARPDGDVELPERAYETFVMPSCGGAVPHAGALRDLREHVLSSSSSSPSPSHAIVAQSVLSPPAGPQPCRGFLKPSVVFFGGSVPRRVTSAASDLVSDAGSVLVLGSTLAVHSSYRLARAAAKEGKPVGVVTYGETRADALEEAGPGSGVVKAAASASAVLERLLLLGLKRGEGRAARALEWLRGHSEEGLHPILEAEGAVQWVQCTKARTGSSSQWPAGGEAVPPGAGPEAAASSSRAAAASIQHHGPGAVHPPAPPTPGTDPAVLRGTAGVLPDDDPPPVPHLEMRPHLPWCV